MPPEVQRRTLGLAGYDVPVVELAGAADGPRLTVLAGVHGCEYAPMAAVRRWTRALAQRELRGTVRAVPVLNLPSFRARTPFVVPDDGKNLNRCFPGDPAGTLAQRLAYDTFTQLIVGSDALVDVHAGDMVEALEPFALYDAGISEARASELAVGYGLGYVIRQEAGPDRTVGGMTSTAAAEIGIPRSSPNRASAAWSSPPRWTGTYAGLTGCSRCSAWRTTRHRIPPPGRRRPGCAGSSGCTRPARAGGSRPCARVSRSPGGSCSEPSAPSTARRCCRR